MVAKYPASSFLVRSSSSLTGCRLKNCWSAWVRRPLCSAVIARTNCSCMSLLTVFVIRCRRFVRFRLVGIWPTPNVRSSRSTPWFFKIMSWWCLVRIHNTQKIFFVYKTNKDPARARPPQVVDTHSTMTKCRCCVVVQAVQRGHAIRTFIQESYFRAKIRPIPYPPRHVQSYQVRSLKAFPRIAKISLSCIVLRSA